MGAKSEFDWREFETEDASEFVFDANVYTVEQALQVLKDFFATLIPSDAYYFHRDDLVKLSREVDENGWPVRYYYEYGYCGGKGKKAFPVHVIRYKS